ncbi:MAG: cation:proton antiporter [Bryobacterales bacterium]|nr:cation:proton antiporter [Bryobacterales bacterium]
MTGAAGHQLPVTMFAVFGLAKALEEFCERIGISPVVGQILAGVILGPGLLNYVQPNELLGALAELGVMFLLFQVGLEVKASELLKVGGTATLTAVLGVAVPFVLGYAICAAWGFTTIEATFAGAAMVATSVGITAKVLAAQGLLRMQSAKIILAAAVIDDVIGLLVLAVVSGMAKGAVDYTQLATTAALAIGFTVIIAGFGSRAAGHLARRTETLRVAESEFAVAMVLLFGLAVLSSIIGVAAIVGAFLAGMMLSESAGHRLHDLTYGVSELLVPFFLAGIGLHLQLSIFNNRSTLLLGVVILVAAVASKIVGCGLGAMALGRAEAIRVGVGMVPRGEVGMVVAQIGFGLGVVSHELYGVAVFMAVMTTVIAPPLLKWAYREAAASA